MNAKWKGGGTRWNSSGGLEELGRRRCRYVVGSAPEYFRAGENAGFMPSRGTTEFHICSEAGDSETPGDAEGTASILKFSLKLKLSQYPSLHTNYIITHCTTL